MNWDDLRILLALVRSGSLTRASHMLQIDQSTVGRRLSALEAALGTTLFLRSKSGLIPTEVGEKLISDAIEMERRAEQITQTAASPAKEPVGELRIVGDHWVLAHLAEHFVPNLRKLHPRLSLRLSSGYPTAASWTAATVSLWFEDPPQMGEFAIKLTDVPYALFAASNCNAQRLGWVSMLDDSASRRLPVRVLEKLRKRDEPVHVVANDPALLKISIRQGLGKGLLPTCIAEHEGDLMQVEGDGSRFVRPLHLHVHPDTVQTLRVQIAIRLLRESARELFSEFCRNEKAQPCRKTPSANNRDRAA